MKSSDILLGKLNTEFKTVSAMIEIYCKKNHHSETLCEECQQLMDYAEVRLDRCPYGENKPTCNTCPIHCYKPEPKEQMRLVMRFSGPRMLLHHPILAIRHLLSEKRTVVDKPQPNASNRHIRLKNGNKE
ncbi:MULTISPECIES: nitrous oxide-stimulated promoter family protein [Aliivibrio]|uniref:nitrous oxide-stimulated promoter family protein n=1 Tax=Aliivibrio TaxID=511678 RepID=UPI00090814A0|nr:MULTISPECIES: nitrous oxide-stimulated promoter family protein [Aliivibrio]MBD1569693.1 nitrous oxide-stimulated promoter family protein [Aliivibrio sp. S10_S31]MUJ22282.1 nitrous oxide-stimulated promoter family protein [Aliivibrio fischeri]